MSVMVHDPKKSFHATYLTPLLAGAVAGLSVDVALYPLDTVKTRLQSAQGFQNAGGFKGVYTGLLTVATTSVPTASLFFMSYEATKTIFEPLVRPQYAPFVHMFAASVGEVLACVIRVPTEIAKQRKQTYVGSAKKSSIGILIEAYRTEGFFRGVYRGFFSTVLRDLPFSFIELPVWEMLKTIVRNQNNGEVTSFQSAVCGSVAGGFAAGVTTPLDLVKTRIMLAEVSTRDSQVSTRDGQVSTRDGQVSTRDGHVSTRNGQVSVNRLRIPNVLCEIYHEKGVRGLFAGVTPRVTAFMMGGFVFFGVYDFAKSFLETRIW